MVRELGTVRCKECIQERQFDDLSAPGYLVALLKDKLLLMFKKSLIPPSSESRSYVVQGERLFVPQQNSFH